jgi:hypothetical protein
MDFSFGNGPAYNSSESRVPCGAGLREKETLGEKEIGGLKTTMKRVTLGIATPLVLVLLAAAPKVFSDDYDKKTDVTIDKPIQVPGATLQPGTYMFILMNSSSNRHIVEIKSEDGKKLYATTFTTAARRVTPTGKVVLSFYEMPAGTPDAVRQWYWPGDTEGEEFLYTHKQAAEIKAARHENEAVAETNEEPPASTSNLNAAAAESTDQQSAQQVAEQPAPQPAAESQAVNQSQQSDSSQVVVAQTTPQVDNPPADNSANNSNDLVAQNNTPQPEPQPAPVPDTSAAQAPAPNTVASNDNDNALPQTASNIPLVGLLGLLSLTGGMILKLAWRS